MPLGEKILAGIAIAIAVWFIKSVVSYLLQKGRLQKALITDIKFHLSGVNEAKEFINKYSSKYVKEGFQIKHCPNFIRDEYDIYKLSLALIIKFFNVDAIEKVTKFYKAFWELEIQIQGYMKDLNEHKQMGKPLDKDDIEYLKRKQERIMSLAELLTHDQIKKIKDLPSDYRERKGVAYLIP